MSLTLFGFFRPPALKRLINLLDDLSGYLNQLQTCANEYYRDQKAEPANSKPFKAHT
jgi:hypothetical protein